jgi:hypothetical protein
VAAVGDEAVVPAARAAPLPSVIAATSATAPRRPSFRRAAARAAAKRLDRERRWDSSHRSGAARSGCTCSYSLGLGAYEVS